MEHIQLHQVVLQDSLQRRLERYSITCFLFLLYLLDGKQIAIVYRAKKFLYATVSRFIFLFIGCGAAGSSVRLTAQEQTQHSSTATIQISASITAPEAYKTGIAALERQYFRAATEAFRMASILDPANTTYLHQFAKALFYAEGKNRDSVRFAYELMNLYVSLGKESSSLQTQKAQILKTDIENRLETLLQDSLRMAQRDAAKYGYEFGYKARLRPPPEPKGIDSSIAGQIDWRISVILAAGLFQQAGLRFDQWSSGGLDIRGGAWFPLGEGLDWGFDAALAMRVGGILEQTSRSDVADSSTSFKRSYDVGTSVRLRFSPRSTFLFGLSGSLYAENPQLLRTSDNEAWQSLRLYSVVGGGLFLEPRIGAQGVVFEAKYYALGIIGTPSSARMLTAVLGYGFGSAELLAEGTYSERPDATMLAINIPATLYARLTLRWHFIQSVSVVH